MCTTVSVRRDLLVHRIMTTLGSVLSSGWGRQMDAYIRLLKTCWKSLHDITNLKLYLEQKPQGWETILVQEWNNVILTTEEFVFTEQKSFIQHQTFSGSRGQNVKETPLVLALGSAYGHKLCMVITQEHESASELQRKVKSVSRKVKKLTQLKIILEELTTFVDRIMNFNTLQILGSSSANFPALEDIKMVKDKICDLKSNFMNGELHDLLSKYNEHLHTNEENIVCDILGISGDFGCELHELNSGARQHKKDIYFLERFIENRENRLSEEDIAVMHYGQGREGLIGNLDKLGFTFPRASGVCDSIPNELIDLQSPSFWAMRYLEHVFFCHPLFSSIPRYPYQRENKDKFFIKDILMDRRCEPEKSSANGKSLWPVTILNVSNNEVSGKIIEEFLKKQDKGCKLFFHGTSHEHAVSILESGIRVNDGQGGQDFSSGDGFYVSEVFQNAKDWSMAGRGCLQAVVVFKIPSSLVDAQQEGGKDFTLNKEREKEWEQIVELCRCNYDNTKLKKQLLRGVTFVRGPVCRNPTQIDRSGPAGFEMRDDPASLQLCVRDEEYAEKFGSIENILCVIFY